MIWISFFTIFLLAPIPVTHFILHAFLPFWRKYTVWFYLTSMILWILSFFVAVVLARFGTQLFTPLNQLTAVSVVLALFALFMILSSVITIGPKRFFLWAVLKPTTVEQKYIKSGPYYFISHPAYFGYTLITIAAFLATGRAVMFGFFLYTLFLILVVILLENHEIKKRLNKKQ